MKYYTERQKIVEAYQEVLENELSKTADAFPDKAKEVMDIISDVSSKVKNGEKGPIGATAELMNRGIKATMHKPYYDELSKTAKEFGHGLDVISDLSSKVKNGEMGVIDATKEAAKRGVKWLDRKQREGIENAKKSMKDMFTFGDRAATKYEQERDETYLDKTNQLIGLIDGRGPAKVLKKVINPSIYDDVKKSFRIVKDSINGDKLATKEDIEKSYGVGPYSYSPSTKEAMKRLGGDRVATKEDIEKSYGVGPYSYSPSTMKAMKRLDNDSIIPLR